MLVLPSGDGEYAISVYSKTSRNRETIFYVAYTEANQNLWYEREYRDSPSSFPLGRQPVMIRRNDSTIPGSTAVAIHRAWKKMLSGTRESRKVGTVERIVLDPTEIIFSVPERYPRARAGELPFEPGRHAAALWKLGNLLVTYCKADPVRRPEIAKQIEGDANRLVSDLERTTRQDQSGPNASDKSRGK